MDYNPVNIMPEGVKQGDFFSHDDRAVRHVGDRVRLQAAEGRVADGGAAELQKIAARSGERGLAFASDQDARGIDPDPHSVRYDLGNDLVAYAKAQAQLVAESWPNVVDDMTKDGDGYQRARRAFRRAAGAAW